MHNINVKYITIAVAFAIGVAVLFAFDPAESDIFPPCPFHYLTGLHCPGCGTLRALHRLSHGNLTGALSMNPLAVVSIPFIVLLIARPYWAYRPWVCWLVLGVFLIYWVIRNIPTWPFVLLTPG